MEIKDVQRYLPQRPPILMLDEVSQVIPGKSGIGVKTFAAEDSYFEGHFPSRPILPGIFLIEAFAQTAMVVLMAREDQDEAQEEGEIGFLAKVNDVSFYETVEPGDRICFVIKFHKKVKEFIIVEGQALNDGRRVAKAKLTLAIPVVEDVTT